MSGHIRTILSKIKLHTRCGSYLGRLTPTFFLEKESISHILLEEKEYSEIISPFPQPDLERAITSWLDEYASGKEPKTQLPLKPLSKGVEMIRSIPFGHTLSYKGLATQLGNPKGARAAGKICNKNPYPLLIPCHRVIRADGSLGGFAYPHSLKELLITFERSRIGPDHAI